MFTLDKLTAATADFQKYVEPQLYDSGMFDPKDSYVVVCEGDSDDLKAKMDQFAGIDMVTIDKQHQTVQGIASRIQHGPCWHTFTVRALTDRGNFDTELKKRLLAIQNGDMYPTWTIQAYVFPVNGLIQCTVGVIRTVELFNYIKDQLSSRTFKDEEDFFDMLRYDTSIGELDIRRNSQGGAVFIACDWETLIHRGINLTIMEGTFGD
jgi:hypothetical protein